MLTETEKPGSLVNFSIPLDHPRRIPTPGRKPGLARPEARRGWESLRDFLDKQLAIDCTICSRARRSSARMKYRECD